eukprot:gene3456-10657_t
MDEERPLQRRRLGLSLPLPSQLNADTVGGWINVLQQETNSVLLASHYCSLTSLVRENTETSLTALGSRLEEFAVTIVEHVRSPDITLALAALPMVGVYISKSEFADRLSYQTQRALLNALVERLDPQHPVLFAEAVWCLEQQKLAGAAIQPLVGDGKGSLAWKLALGAAAHRQTIGSTLLEIEVLGVVATLLSRVPDAMHACARRWAGLVVAGWSHSDNAVQAMALEHDSSVVLTSGAAAAAAEAGQRFSGHSHHRHHPANAFPANASEIVIASDSRSGTKHLFKQLKTWFALPGAEHAASALRAWIGLTRLLLGPSTSTRTRTAHGKRESAWKLDRTVLNDVVAFPLSQFTSCATHNDAVAVFELWYQTVCLFNSFGTAPLEKKVAAMLLKPVLKRPSKTFLGFLMLPPVSAVAAATAAAAGAAGAAVGAGAADAGNHVGELDAVRFKCWWDVVTLGDSTVINVDQHPANWCRIATAFSELVAGDVKKKFARAELTAQLTQPEIRIVFQQLRLKLINAYEEHQ